MLRSEGNQISFLMTTTVDQMVPQDHPLMKIARSINFGFVREETEDLYVQGQGRPAYPPEQLFKVLLLEVWMKLSDVQICQQLHYNLLYRAFCGIGWEDPIPDDTTLVRFRARLGHERFERLFQRVVSLLKERGLVSEEWMIVDGTKVVADVAVRNTLELVREGRKRLVRALSRVSPEKAEGVASFAAPLPDGEYANRELLLAAEMEQGRRLLEALPEDVPDEGLKRLAALYRDVLEGDGTASFVDPDARWGFKRTNDPFLGYKTHIACDENGMVTSLVVTPGPGSEPVQVEALLKGAERAGVHAKRLVGDKGYDAVSARTSARHHNLRAFIPWRSRTQLPEGFRFVTGQKLRCPKGQVSRALRHPGGGLVFVFSQRVCQKCPLRLKCLQGREKRKRIYYRHDRQTSPLGMKRAMIIRREVERVFGGAKRWLGYERARYRGLHKMIIQSVLTFMVWNLKKAAVMEATT